MASSNHLSLVTQSFVIVLFFCCTVFAFPDLEAFASHEHQHGTLHEKLHSHPLFKRKDETERKLYERQLDGLLSSLTGQLTRTSGTQDGQGAGAGGIETIIGSAINILGFGYGDIPVDVWGKYPFYPPGQYDQRGPCPGLNAMANHGIISRTGVTNLIEATAALMGVFGLTIEHALLVVLFGLIPAGDVTTLQFSIGGPTPLVPQPLGGAGGLLGLPQGLDYSHNAAEVDGSLTRDDLYVTGNAWTLSMPRFLEYYSSVPEGYPITQQDVARVCALRLRQCIATNPWCYIGPLTGFVFRTGAAVFSATLFANYSSQNGPDGILTHEILKSFYGISDYPAPFTYNEGWERIPPNFYPRGTLHSFSALEFFEKVFQWAGWYPELFDIGGNMGAVNTFTGLQVDGDGIALPMLTDPSAYLCFVLEALKVLFPSFTNNIFATVFGTLTGAISTTTCPEVGSYTHGGVPIWDYAKQVFPGAQRAGRGF